MKKLILTLVIALITISAMAHEEQNRTPYVEIKGTAEMEVTPDEVYISINIDEKDSKGKLSIESQQKNMADALTSLGIDIDKNLKVLSLASEAFRRKDAVTSGRYELMVSTPLMVGKVYDALNKLEITEINISKVTHSKIKEYTKTLQIEAVKDAKEQAKAILSAIGERSTKCLSIEILNNNSYRNSRYNSDVVIRGISVSNKDSAADSTPKLDFKKIKLEASILATFNIW